MFVSHAQAGEYIVRKLKPRSQYCRVYAVMVFRGDNGILERLVLSENGSYRFADVPNSSPGSTVVMNSMNDVIANIPEAKVICLLSLCRTHPTDRHHCV